MLTGPRLVPQLRRSIALPAVAAVASIVLALSPLQAAERDPIVCVPQSEFVAPPEATLPTPQATGLPRRVYEGATPPLLDPAKPVLVFVHGLHGSAASWSATEYHGRNDIYDTAYDRGYKVFFVDLWDAQGLARTSLDNGRLLKEQLEWIADYWGVDRLNLIAHSKGGLDGNVAALMGAPVDSIVTLGSPHWGSPLADLAQTEWLDWLAELLGYNDAGTKFLQTGCMALGRSVLDALPGNNELSIFTTAGTAWGPVLSALSFGGLYLAGVCPGGDNDGLVCVTHAKHPWARDPDGTASGDHRLVWDQNTGDFDLDHDNIRKGSAYKNFLWPWEPDNCFVPVFDSIEPYAGAFGEPLGPVKAPVTREVAPRERRPLAAILRGGPIRNGRAHATFPLEDGASRLHLRLLVARADTRITLVDPTGARTELPGVSASAGEIFRGAYVAGLDLTGPLASGDWSLEFMSSGVDAYALVAAVESDLDLRLEFDSDKAARVLGPDAPEVDWVEVEAVIRGVSTAAGPATLERRRWSGLKRSELQPRRPGVYNVALTIRGELRGLPFERNTVVSIGVAGSAGPGLPAVCE